MKHNKLTMAILMALAVFAASAPAHAADTYKIDAVHSFAIFKVGHLGVGYVRGGFTDIAGSIAYGKDTEAGSLVEITIATNSVNTHNKDRDAHLRTDDFFDVEKYPEMSFKSKSFKKLETGKYQVTGDFTLHGVTKTITVTADVTGEGDDPWGNYRAGFETSFTIMRSDYGMDKQIPAAGDKVWITLNIEAIRQKSK
jgi:polyisoprenoid-binding protein YceI